jgi:hypothetical protein
MGAAIKDPLQTNKAAIKTVLSCLIQCFPYFSSCAYKRREEFDAMVFEKRQVADCFLIGKKKTL